MHPTVHQTRSRLATKSISCRDWPSRVPIVTTSSTPAAAARASTPSRSAASNMSKWKCESINMLGLGGVADMTWKHALRRRQPGSAFERPLQRREKAVLRGNAKLIEQPLHAGRA